jgi:type I restriction enzyme S subunit
MRDGWVEATLSEILTISRERVDPSRLKPDYELIHWSIPQLDETGGPKNEMASEIGSHKFAVLKDSVVYSLLNPRIPRFAKIVGGERVVCSTEFAVLQPNSNLSLDFLHCFVSSPIFKEQVRSLAKGTTKSRERIDHKVIEKLHIKLPPLPEQKRIVDLISSVDSYIEALQQQLESAKRSRNAILHELLTAGGDDWVETSLGEIAEVIGGGTPSTTIGEYWDGDIVWLTPTEITSQDGKVVSDSIRKITDLGLKNSGAQMLPKDSVILTSRASVGFVALAGKELCTNQGFQSLIPKPSVLSKFLMFWIQQNRPEFESRSAGSTFKEISKSNVKSIKLQLPPLSEQKRIVEIIHTFDEVISQTELTISKAQNLRSGLLSDLLSGEHEIPVTYDKVMGAA